MSLQAKAPHVPATGTPLNRITCSTLNVPDLPPEIIDRIIDHLWDQISDLYQCALVCKAWLPCARYHAFSTILLNRRRQCERFERLLIFNPNICLLVKELGFSLMGPPFLPDWLPTISETLPHLSRLHILGGGVFSSASFRGLPLLRVLNIAHIRFRQFNDFITTIHNLPALQELCIHSVELGINLIAQLPFSIDTILQPPMLRRLEFIQTRVDPDLCLGWLIKDKMVHSVERLVIRPLHRSYLPLLDQLLRLIGPNLKHLGITITGQREERGYDGTFSFLKPREWCAC